MFVVVKIVPGQQVECYGPFETEAVANEALECVAQSGSLMEVVPLDQITFTPAF